MPRQIVIVGAGFAGVWSALSAKRLIDLANRDSDVKITVISPEPFMVIRPRLYEANVSTMTYPLEPLFKDAGIGFFHGTARSIQTEARTVGVRSISGDESSISYDRLILAAGSTVVRPPRVTGLEEHAFDIDTLHAATKLETHLRSLISHPASPVRNTVVVCGGGFTGIELAAELPRRLESLPGFRVVLVEGSDALGPELGAGPRPTITQALKELGVEVKTGSPVVAIDAGGVVLASGERIETATAIWTVGMKAVTLTEQIPGPKDASGRIHVDQKLRVPSVEGVFATGDTAYVLADVENDRHALMSCQHALQLGRVSGHNAAADLIGEPLINYSQEDYVTCLDMGAWGAVLSKGWERDVKVTGEVAKKVKTMINQRLIYPPTVAKDAISAANPISPPSDNPIERLVQMATA